MRIFFVLFMVFTSIGAFGKIDVFVTIDPQAWLVQRIGNQFVDIHVLVKPGSSPATFTPTPRQMIAILKSKIYFKVDAFFENLAEFKREFCIFLRLFFFHFLELG